MKTYELNGNVEVTPYKKGMEDGYSCYYDNGIHHGFISKHSDFLHKTDLITKPVIRTSTGRWAEVVEGWHYIVRFKSKRFDEYIYEEVFDKTTFETMFKEENLIAITEDFISEKDMELVKEFWNNSRMVMEND